MQVILNAKKLFIAPGALLLLALTACGPQGSLEESGSSLREFKAGGSATPVSVADLRAQPLGLVLASPDRCAALVSGVRTVALWAGYTDEEAVEGKARGKCAAKGDSGNYCVQDNSYFEESSGRTVFGMELPRVFELGSTASYICESAARSLGLRENSGQRVTLGAEKVSVEHVSSLSASATGLSQAIRDVYVISVVANNSKTNRNLTKKFYFAADGRPIGVRNSQEQNFNEDVQRQTGELHFLYPNTAPILNDPKI